METNKESPKTTHSDSIESNIKNHEKGGAIDVKLKIEDPVEQKEIELSKCTECKYLLHIKGELEKNISSVNLEKQVNDKKLKDFEDINFKLTEQIKGQNIDFNTFKQENAKLSLINNDLNNKIVELKHNYKSSLEEIQQLKSLLEEQENTLKENYIKNNIVIPIVQTPEINNLNSPFPGGIRVPAKTVNSRSGMSLVNKRSGTLL
jgi:Zn-finger nucleic acid-binding protein